MFLAVHPFIQALIIVIILLLMLLGLVVVVGLVIWPAVGDRSAGIPPKTKLDKKP